MATILPFKRSSASDDAMIDTAVAAGPDAASELTDDQRWAGMMVLAQDGDRVAYHALLKAVAPYLRAIARRYLGVGEDAEDAVQDVLMIIHGVRHTYERGRPFKPWIGTIASRRCIDLLRKRAHRLRHELVDGEGIEAHEHGGHGPEDTLARAHAAATLREAVAALPVRQREAVELLRLKELSLKEASAHSAQSVGSLKVASHRGIKSLYRALVGKESSDD